MTKGWKRPVVWLDCEECGASHPAQPNASPSVPRETRCPRCLNAEIARLQRQVAEYVAMAAGAIGHA